jgi:hypothetical protein
MIARSACAVDIIAEGHVKAFALQLASLFFVVATAAFCQNTRLSDSCDLSIIGATDAKSFLAFDKELRAAIAKQDSAAMSVLVKYPLRVNTGRGNISIDDPAALQARFQEIFTAAVRKAIVDQKIEEIFCRDEGAMYGSGQVWVNVAHYGFAIDAINLESTQQSTAARRSLEFICQTDKYRIVVDSETPKTSRYRAWNRPHPLTGPPDLELLDGAMSFEGTGLCSHRLWTFKNGVASYVVQDLGCTENAPPKDATGMFEVQVSSQTKARGWCY